MKEVVEKSKQTVWVLTMLTVMIVLSAYYLISDPFISQDVINSTDKQDIVTDINTESVVSPEMTNDAENTVDLVDEIGSNASDLFVGLKMERSSNRTKQLDQLYTMMQSSSSEETIAGLQSKIENILAIEESEFVLEKLIISEGFNDAVVLTNDSSVDVVVQSSSLTNAQAVKIIKMVSDRLNLPAVNVHIKQVK